MNPSPPLEIINGQAFWRGCFKSPEDLRRLRNQFANEPDFSALRWPQKIDAVIRAVEQRDAA